MSGVPWCGLRCRLPLSVFSLLLFIGVPKPLCEDEPCPPRSCGLSVEGTPVFAPEALCFICLHRVSNSGLGVFHAGRPRMLLGSVSPAWCLVLVSHVLATCFVHGCVSIRSLPVASAIGSEFYCSRGFWLLVRCHPPRFVCL